MNKTRYAVAGALAGLALIGGSVFAGGAVMQAAGIGNSQAGTLQVQQAAQHGWLGLLLREDNGKVLVAGVVPNGPAANAGLQKDDVIVSINGQNIVQIQQARQATMSIAPNTQVTIQYQRGGNTATATLTAAEMPQRPRRGNGPNGQHGQGKLNRIPFDNHFGGTNRYKDANGNTVTIGFVFGKVASVDANAKTVTITKNEGGTQTFTVDDATRLVGRKGLAELQPNDEVLVTYDQAHPNVAKAILDHHAAARGTGGIPGRFLAPFRTN